MSIYKDFMVPRPCQFTEILWCPDYVNLQRFCRDFIVPRLCQFTEILWCPTMSIDRDFAEISWCPDYVNLQRFYGGQFTEILYDKTKPVKSL